MSQYDNVVAEMAELSAWNFKRQQRIEELEAQLAAEVKRREEAERDARYEIEKARSQLEAAGYQLRMIEGRHNKLIETVANGMAFQPPAPMVFEIDPISNARAEKAEAELAEERARLDWLEQDMAKLDDGTAVFYEDGLYRFPYLMRGEGGYGGGVGERAFCGLRAAIDAARGKR